MRRTFYLLFLSGAILFAGCKKNTPLDISLINPEGEKTKLSSWANIDYIALCFVSPLCPLSENYTKTINEIADEFYTVKTEIAVVAIIPGNNYSQAEIDKFLKDYPLRCSVLLDKDLALTKKLGAEVTPEVIVIDMEGKIIYSGAIDNWAVELGQKREVITEHYLVDVLSALRRHEPVTTPSTKAVGCFIEMNNE